MEGAGVLRKIWHITLPQLRGVLLITLILQFIATAQVFLDPYLFTGGGPAYATTTVLLLIDDYAFASSLGGNYGAATALSVKVDDDRAARPGPGCSPLASTSPASSTSGMRVSAQPSMRPASPSASST